MHIDGAVRPATFDQPPAEFASSPDEYLGDKLFRFLNRDGDLNGGWNNPQYERLWLYNLHYFNYLNQSTRNHHAYSLGRLIDAWIVANPVGMGAGWEAYPLSLRIVNWIKWASTGQPMTSVALTSLYVQARYLAQRLEYHLLGNHLFANAKALVCAGLFFDTPEASCWLATGLAILRRELPRQVLEDGGHIELSPMYHAIFIEDLLDIVNLATCIGTHRCSADAENCLSLARKPLPRMMQWLRTMTHPDGEIVQFNDAAFGIARPYAVLAKYAGRLGLEVQPASYRPPLTTLDASGYVRAECGDYVAFLDIARVGPDYLPGHAHADTLTFELSLDGQRLIIDAGTSTYVADEQRTIERGTSAHNTVTYQAQNSSDVWSAFRVGRRAYPIDIDMRAQTHRGRSSRADNSGTRRTGEAVSLGAIDRATWSISAAHTGYAHLPGSIIHRRTWHGDEETLLIVDRLERPDGRTIADLQGTFATLRFAAHIDLTESAAGHVIGSADGKVVCHVTHTGSAAHIVNDFHYPRFGVKVPCKVLRLSFLHATLVTRLSFRTPA
ncbi:heparinase II/III family protein [Paraburkholderia phymatum]|uniref:Heparinase II/III family protein n=1 Tax=Paraburkholderia phymatum TaxID=148447 RepID=A0ACC6UC55_9BURK